MADYQFLETWLEDRRVLHGRVERGGAPLGTRQAVEDLCSGRLGEALSQSLARAPFEAFRWETPAWSDADPNRPFEYVVVNSPDLQRSADPSAFESYFDPGRQRPGVVSFPNLGGDSLLVVPESTTPQRDFSHFAAFLRHADGGQKENFWRIAGEVLLDRFSPKPVWLSTAGDGVPWLHLRLDDRPKYYAYAPFRELQAS